MSKATTADLIAVLRVELDSARDALDEIEAYAERDCSDCLAARRDARLEGYQEAIRVLTPRLSDAVITWWAEDLIPRFHAIGIAVFRVDLSSSIALEIQPVTPADVPVVCFRFEDWQLGNREEVDRVVNQILTTLETANGEEGASE